MAPPRHRNRGFSRRIQYGLFFGYVAAAIGIVAGLGLLLVARYDPLAFQGIRGLALDLTTPLSTFTRPIARGAGSVGGQAGAYLDAARQNLALRDELADARRQLIAARATAFENKRLRRMVRLIDPSATPVAAARIVGSDLLGVRRYATLAAGSADGIAAGQPVRGPDGLIGRVAEAGAHAARVLLLTDGASSVPVRIVRTGLPVLAQGRGEALLELHATTIGPAPFLRGDLLVTSGVGGVYPPGIPVAVVTSASGEIASARPLADPARLDYAVILPSVAMPPPPAKPIGDALMRTAADPYQQDLPARLWIVPVASTLAGSMVALLPIVAGAPLMPPLGLLVALAWRLRRPEMWPAWIALPLGLFDDLLGGAAVGTAMCLWTTTFLLIDVADHRPMWRDHWLDWALACLALQFCALGSWASAALTGGGGGSGPALVMPQTILAILCFPIVARACARFDGWRLKA